MYNRLHASNEVGGIALKTGEIGFSDVATLSRATGWEYGVVRLKDGTRMLLQGNTRSLPHIGDFDVEKIIVHAHPGNTPYHLMPSGINGDLGYIWSIGQKRSYIVTSGASKGGVENWIGSFDNEGYWYGINTPVENCVQGVIPDVRLGN